MFRGYVRKTAECACALATRCLEFRIKVNLATSVGWTLVFLDLYSIPYRLIRYYTLRAINSPFFPSFLFPDVLVMICVVSSGSSIVRSSDMYPYIEQRTSTEGNCQRAARFDQYYIPVADFSHLHFAQAGHYSLLESC